MKRILAQAVGCCAVVACCLAVAAEPAVPAYREVVRQYIGHHKDAQDGNQPAAFPLSGERVVALEYTVLLRKDGVDVPVDTQSYRFKQGDQIRVRIQSLQDLFLYVFFEDEAGCRRCLLPSDKNSPRLVKHDQPVELPTDGSVFEFEAAAKPGSLVLIASDEAEPELTTLCDAVCKKQEALLTPEERYVQTQLRQRNEKALAAIEQSQAMALVYRGPLSAKVFDRLAAEMKESGADDVFVQEPATQTQASNLVMLVSRLASHHKLSVTIPLKSAPVE
ncbi:MAG TPA: DUF4384 domain-containing protein [Pirellulales bacterium]|nr:DUF4384 domain-containing protein [Pirellulales bacterium]